MTVTSPSERPVGRWARWKNAVFIASLALNLLIVGLFATAAIRHGIGHRQNWGKAATVISFARTLPEERRRAIWADIRSERRAMRPYWAELRRVRAEMRAALHADPFDPDRYRAAHNRLLEAEVAARKAAHSLYETVALKLTASERRELANWPLFAERPRRKRSSETNAPDDNDTELPADTAPGKTPPATSKP